MKGLAGLGAALAAALALGACAGDGVQHIYPQERPAGDQYDPRPDPDAETGGVFSGEGWRWVRERVEPSEDEDKGEEAD